MSGVRTWDDHGLATHDEDDLHGPELSHVQSLALQYGLAQFEREDARVEPNGHSLGDLHLDQKMVVGSHGLLVHCLVAVNHCQGKTETYGYQSDQCCCGHDGVFVEWLQGDTDNPNLQAQGDHDQDDKE